MVVNHSLYKGSMLILPFLKFYKTPDHWYPSDPKKVAKIDAYLDWHPNGTRKSIDYLFLLAKVKFEGKQSDQQFKEPAIKEFLKILDDLEKVWLKDEKFISGADEISIADLSAFCELSEFQFVGYEFDEYPKLHAWCKKMAELEGIKKSNDYFKIVEFMKAKIAGKF